MNLKVSFKATDTTQDLVTNFEELKKEVANEVEKYSVEVTEENIPEAKKVMANMNKVKAEIANKYKHHIDTLSLPIQQLKSEKKELENIITKGRQDIADKVSIFEQKKLDIAGEVIFKYLTDVCLEKSIDWKVVQVNDLIKLTA
ncbi:MAG: CAP-Gly protein, partial [Epsilonproteobacteria bacterium]